MKLDAVQALLEELEGRVCQVVVERLGQDFPVLDDANDPRPLAHKEPAGAVLRAGDVNRIDETAGHFDELDGRVARKFPARVRGVGGLGRLGEGKRGMAKSVKSPRTIGPNCGFMWFPLRDESNLPEGRPRCDAADRVRANRNATVLWLQ